MLRVLCMILAALVLAACGAGETPAESGSSRPAESQQESAQPQQTQSGEEDSVLKITVGDTELLATFEDNSSAEAFRELLAQKLSNANMLLLLERWKLR